MTATPAQLEWVLGVTATMLCYPESTKDKSWTNDSRHSSNGGEMWPGSLYRGCYDFSNICGVITTPC